MPFPVFRGGSFAVLIRDHLRFGIIGGAVIRYIEYSWASLRNNFRLQLWCRCRSRFKTSDNKIYLLNYTPLPQPRKKKTNKKEKQKEKQNPSRNSVRVESRCFLKYFSPWFSTALLCSVPRVSERREDMFSSCKTQKVRWEERKIRPTRPPPFRSFLFSFRKLEPAIWRRERDRQTAIFRKWFHQFIFTAPTWCRFFDTLWTHRLVI